MRQGVPVLRPGVRLLVLSAPADHREGITKQREAAAISRPFFVRVLAVATVFACSADEPPDGDGRLADLLHEEVVGPTVVQVDSLLLEETEFHLGRPYSLSADTVDGSFVVADGYLGRMLRFARDGRFMRAYGRPGEGPGEFRGLGRGFILNDSVVVGRDNHRNLLTRFSRDGEHLGSTRYEGFKDGWAAVAGDVVLLPAIDLERQKMVRLWDWRRDETLGAAIDLPVPYRRSLRGRDIYFGVLAGSSIVAWADTMLVGTVAENELYLATWDDRMLDTLHLPRARRRGVPSDAQERIDDPSNQVSFKDRMEMLSTLEGLYRMPDGSTVAVHHDGLIDGEPPMVEFLAEVYVTVLSPDRRTACVDGAVQFGNQLRTQIAAARDTLFLLDRTLTAVGDTMKSWIRVYEIDTSRCDWLAVR